RRAGFRPAPGFITNAAPVVGCAGRRQGGPLYHAPEAERLRAFHPLRLATPATGPGEQLLTRTALPKAGYSRATNAAMTPGEKP
ncbi:hypothetical protein D6Q91_25785, partial [Salmonella enterica subsp. enterica]|nr:hypothetical protein [Salmonella enterica subsp. enterica serovar Braenderup]